MIERYTIKFGPAVGQKTLEKMLHESGETPDQPQFNQLRARIELVADFVDLRKISELFKELSRK
jgi:hypothetical protein